MVNIFKYLLRFFRRKRKKVKMTHEEVNVVESVVKAKKLYKELILKAHPDRYVDKMEVAQSFTEKVNANRFNYRELLKLKELIEKELY